MIEYHVYDQDDAEQTAALLVGRRIVAVEQNAQYTGPEFRFVYTSGWLTLDDGTVILVKPHEGCGGCPRGNYDLTRLATVDNVITSVRLACESHSTTDFEPDKSYRIYVVADAVEINAVQIDGNDGDGHDYGTGYELFVIAP